MIRASSGSGHQGFTHPRGRLEVSQARVQMCAVITDARGHGSLTFVNLTLERPSVNVYLPGDLHGPVPAAGQGQGGR